MSNQSKTLNEIRELAERLFPAETSSLVGASDRLIALLEELFDLQFPTVYQEYLRWSGNTASFFCGGQYNAGRHLVRINLWARDLLLNTHSSFRFAENHLVISWDVGQTFYFVELNGSDDPPVYIFMDPATVILTRSEDLPENLATNYSFIFDSSLDNSPAKFTDTFSDFLRFNLMELTKLGKA